MSATHLPLFHVTPKLYLPLAALAICLWAVVGSVNGQTTSQSTASHYTQQCQSAADIIAAQNASRNGVSLSCNQAVLLERNAS